MRKKRNIIIFAIAAILVVGLLIIMPFIVHSIYETEAPNGFFTTTFNASDFLVYYASALSFLGTLILGVLTLVQNKKAQDRAEEINHLELDLQKRSMVMAEEQYKNDNRAIIPKFQIQFSMMSGFYGNPAISIKNVSSIIVSNLTPITFSVKDNEATEICSIRNFYIRSKYLLSGQETRLELKMKSLPADYRDICMYFEFSCEDEKYNKHFYRAEIQIPSVHELVGSPWKVEKVG